MILTSKKTVYAVVLFVLLFALAPSVIAQTQPRPEWTGGGAPDEKISLSETLMLEQALKLINDITLKEKKVIIDNSGKTMKIGVEIVNLPWRRALDLICSKNHLEYEEGSNYIRVFDPNVKDAAAGKDVDLIDINSREVNIEAIFFEADRSTLRELGVNWSMIQQGQVPVNILQNTDSNVTNNNVFSISTSKKINNTMSVAGIVKTFQDNGKGTIIANPQIRVRAGKTGYVQVGQDFSIKTRDFAGNTIDNFVSAGTILQVTPTVLTDNDLTFVHLKLDVERSTGSVNTLTTTIDKTKASTSLLLLPGEEAAIGGLTTNERNHIRIGIPFLKDLPWWVLGIRYLAGYERIDVTEKELVILLKVDLEPDLKARIKDLHAAHKLQETIKSNAQRFDQILKDSDDGSK